MVRLVHILSMAILYLAGEGIGKVLGLQFAEASLLCSVPLVAFFTWPIWKAFNIRPMLRRCANCVHLEYNTYVFSIGLGLECMSCMSRFLLRGEWKRKGSQRVFYYDKRAILDQLDEVGNVKRSWQLRFPQWLGRWVELTRRERTLSKL